MAEELTRLARRELTMPPRRPIGENGLRRALFAGFADRLARRRPGAGDRLTLASGHGAVLARESGVREAEFLVALDVRGADTRGVAEARIHLASAVDADWIDPTATAVEHALDPASGQVRARRVARFDALTLSETPVAADPEAAPRCWPRPGWRAGRRATTPSCCAGCASPGSTVDLPALVARAAAAVPPPRRRAARRGPGRRRARRQLDRLAPATLPVPSGRQAPLTYADDGSVTASVKLQELFGLADTPVLGPQRVPVTFSLLAPNGRPVQTTRDLRSFWQRTYPEVRKELRGRYPRHPWPDDPWTAMPTHRTTRNERK